MQIKTAKGTFHGTLTECINWQREMQGSFPTLVVADNGEAVSLDDFEAWAMGHECNHERDDADCCDHCFAEFLLADEVE